jgi:hypothetical protein
MIVLAPTAVAECHAEGQASLVKDFDLRLKPYLKVRDEAKSKIPAPKETEDPATLVGRQQALANSIRVARGDARQGDIFSRPLAECLLPLIRRGLSSNTAKRTTKEGNPAHEGPGTKVAVNAPYSAEAPLSTMPPTLLAVLPELPQGLEYRFIGKTLILYDADACLIIDFIPNAGA